MPIEVDEKEFGMSRDALYEALKELNIFPRRYFYPLVCDFACYQSVSVKDLLPVARRVSLRILTLPTYYGLSLDEVQRVCDIISHLRNSQD
jgi:dTDP-4-amino-4,6-dideoxygalactose transaminase